MERAGNQGLSRLPSADLSRRLSRPSLPNNAQAVDPIAARLHRHHDRHDAVALTCARL